MGCLLCCVLWEVHVVVVGSTILCWGGLPNLYRFKERLRDQCLGGGPESETKSKSAHSSFLPFDLNLDPLPACLHSLKGRNCLTKPAAEVRSIFIYPLSGESVMGSQVVHWLNSVLAPDVFVKMDRGALRTMEVIPNSLKIEFPTFELAAWAFERLNATAADQTSDATCTPFDGLDTGIRGHAFALLESQTGMGAAESTSAVKFVLHWQFTGEGGLPRPAAPTATKAVGVDDAAEERPRANDPASSGEGDCEVAR